MADASKSAVRQRRKAPPSAAGRAQIEGKKLPSRELAEETYHVNASLVFAVFFASHLIGALYHPINDCDEVFNFWEPTHYLTHGHGLQTWEYSPVYAIRSWTYAGLHALAILPTEFLPLSFRGKTVEFYFLRIVLGLVCALCETRLFAKITTALNPRIAITFLLVMATSPGMFHASVAYLPSSFSMYGIMLGMAAFMDWRGGLRTAQGIFAIGAGAVLGWPFAAAMILPYLVEELALAVISDRQAVTALCWRVLDGSTRVLGVLAVQIGVEAFFFRKMAIVPFNIVWYNVFSGSGGPDLYGTEPWNFYIRNLFLNFHLWFLLALISLPLLLVQRLFGARNRVGSGSLRGIVFVSPFYLWLGIFTLQPHKEERFMYPAYPALALNAAMALHIILAQLGSTNPKSMISKIPVQLRFLAILLFVFGALSLSAFRTLGTITGYRAPLSVYSSLHQPGASQPGNNVCLGKEWYRFPSHYLLPEDVHAKFVKSEFSGLLPGEFLEDTAMNETAFRPATRVEPAGMNDQNQEDVGKHTDIKYCDFLVDVDLPSTGVSRLEPNYIADPHWEKVRCLPFLDASSSGTVGRLGWIPDLSFLPPQLQRVYGDYCLLKRKKAPVAGTKIDPIPHIETLG